MFCFVFLENLEGECTKACIGVEVDFSLFIWRNRSVSGLACRATCINVFLDAWCSALASYFDTIKVHFTWTLNSSFFHS